MSIHRSQSRHLFTLNGNVRTAGGSYNLAKGQFAIVNKSQPTADGAKVVGDFKGLSDKTVYELRVGKTPVNNTRTAQNSKPYASHPFTIKDVRAVSVSAPKTAAQKFDEVLIGYDGINDNTKLTFEEGVTTVLDVILKGENIGFFTNSSNEYVFKLHFGKEVGETDQQVIERVVERLKQETFPGGIKVTEALEINIVDSTTLSLTGIPYVFSTLTLKDAGDSTALALVQAQYPAYKVVLTDRVGVQSTYTILHPQASALADYNETIPALLKDCADCAAGYAELSAGVVYSVKIEDDGADLSTTVDDLPGFVTGTAVKVGNSVEGFGTYTVVLDNALTDAEITTFLAASAVKSTAIITSLGDVKALCYDNTITTTAWVDGKVCYASTEAYKIQLKDDDCDGTRLAELQAAYPNLTIEAGKATGDATQTVTLSGTTSGSVTVTVAGVEYTQAYGTSLAATATAFVAAHAAAILADTGAVVTNPSSAVILFTDETLAFPEITADGTGMTATVGAIDYVTTATTGGCQRVYSTTVVTNLVCEECDDIFLNKFVSVAPQDFDFISWEKVVADSDANAKMGIKLKAKPFIFSPEEYLYDEVPFYETSAEIKVAGGYVEDVNFSFSPTYSAPFAVKKLSNKEDRDHLGASLKFLEDMSRTYFDGNVRHRGNNVAKAILGEESVLENRKQYVSYTVEVADNGYSQGLGRTSDTAVSYVIHAELGRHTDLEELVNKLAAKAGLEPVQALANL